MAWILLCESYQFSEKIYYSNWDNEFFQMDCFLLAHPVCVFITTVNCVKIAELIKMPFGRDSWAQRTMHYSLGPDSLREWEILRRCAPERCEI